MAHTAKSRASDGPQYHNIEEVELQHLRGEYLSSLHTGSDAQGSYASLSVHTARSSTARLHDHDRFLEDGISTTTTSQYGKDDVDAAQSKQSPSSWMRTLATPFAPLQRGHTHVSNRMKTSRYHGWRMGVILGCFMSFTVLCINIALLIVGAVSHGGYKGGVADLIYGDDITVERWNTGIHVFINILGTCLLSASNYAMQVISSPTREEIDRVHAAGGWLAVGLLSPRNWRKIARKRVRLALALGLSSVPLHMFYNSITFRVLTESTYEQRAISIDSEEYGSIAANVSYTGVAVNTTYANLTNGQWKSDFAHLQSMAYLELILVFDDVKYANESLNDAVPWQKNFDLSIENVYENGGSHTRARTLADMMSPSDWIGQSKYVRDEFEMHIVHAFARYASSRSRIQLSVHFLAVVIAANVFKLAVMVGMLLMDHGHSKYIVTLGDAASSFLANPDPCTEGKCLLEDEKLYAQAEHSTAKLKVDIESTTSMIDASALPVSNGRGWHKRTLGYYALIRDEQARFTAVAVFLMMAVIIGFIISNNGSGWGWATASDGALSFSSNSRSTSATLFNAWLANMPQVLLSFCYMNLNSFCTAMTSAKEWNNLAFAKKGLRVSEPCGQQRSTYFLQLPYRWAMPLIVISTTLHWLLSQTFFLVRIDTFNSEGDLVTPSKNADSATDSGTRSACGVSNSAFVVFFVMFFGLCIGIRVTASRRFVTGLPQAASNSLVISAACHPSVDDVEPHLKAVQWGVVEREMVNGFEHCTLSSEAVRAPEEGEVYH